MISVVIPALNESATVADVITLVRRDPRVREVLVIDDGSTDGTPELAAVAGARVLPSGFLGKGESMREGLLAAKHDFIVYLDADLRGLTPDLVERLVAPLLSEEADFVKARFLREAGRVTVLTARPLLQTFFPELAHLEQPLGGIIAARRSRLIDLSFENDYGVDVGLLLDSFSSGARIKEVDIGHLAHASQSLDALGDMAGQVLRTILDRAARSGRLRRQAVDELREVERITQAELPVILRRVGQAQQLALFSLDGTLTEEPFMVALAARTQRSHRLATLLGHPSLLLEERTRAIAQLFRGVRRKVFEETARQLRLTPGAKETVLALRQSGFRVGIVTNGYFIAAETIRRRVFADFSVAHTLRFDGGRATGDVRLATAMQHAQGCPEHPICKRNVLEHLIERFHLPRTRILAVGDGENDVCLLRAVARSFAFRPKSVQVRQAARVSLDHSLGELLGFVSREAVEPA